MNMPQACDGYAKPARNSPCWPTAVHPGGGDHLVLVPAEGGQEYERAVLDENKHNHCVQYVSTTLLRPHILAISEHGRPTLASFTPQNAVLH
jgi:hypothetical protein